MEILVKEVKANKKGITLPNDTGQTVVVCHNANPWHHLRIYTEEEWETLVDGFHSAKVHPLKINQLIGEPIAAFNADQAIEIDPIFLNLVSVDGKPNQDFVYIKDADRMVQLWDERTAPRNISDQGIGRIRQMGRAS